MEHFNNGNDSDPETRLWECEKKEEIIREVDSLLGEWKTLTAEERSKRLDSLLPGLAVL